MITTTASIVCSGATPSCRLTVTLKEDTDENGGTLRTIHFVDPEDGIEKWFGADDLDAMNRFFIAIREHGRPSMAGVEFGHN